MYLVAKLLGLSLGGIGKRFDVVADIRSALEQLLLESLKGEREGGGRELHVIGGEMEGGWELIEGGREGWRVSVHIPVAWKRHMAEAAGTWRRGWPGPAGGWSG